MSRPAVAALLILALTVATVAVATVLRKSEEPQPRVAVESAASPFAGIHEVGLPTDLTQVADVRWSAERTLLLAAALRGTFEVQLGDGGSPTKVETVWNGGSDTPLWMHYRLAISGDRLAVASPVFAVGWGGADEPQPGQTVYFESAEDIDLHGDSLAVLGLRFDDERNYLPSVAWLLSLSDEDKEPQPLVRSTAPTQGPWPMDSCALFELGAIRYLSDGSLFVLPGVEPGAWLFGPDGQLRRTWQDRDLGVEARCDFTERQKLLMAQHEEMRWEWVHRSRTVDEVLPLPGGDVGVMIRVPEDDGVRWELLRLQQNGESQLHPTKLMSPTDRAFLRGDVRGNEVVLLIAQRWSKDSAVDVAPRLVFAEWAP